MDNLEVYMDLSPVDFPNICRICLNNGDLKPFEESLTKIFMNLTNIEVHPEDNLPSNICIECTSKLRDISNFIDSSKINDSGLRRLLNSEKQSYFEDSLEEPTDRESVCYENDIEVETNETEDENDSDNQQCHKCVLCGEVFSTEEELASHKKGNSACSQKKIKCSHCKKTFTTKNRLNVHMAVHSDERRYECKLCGKKFTFSRNLLRHDNSVHKKLKPFKCELCGKDVNMDPEEHLKTHSSTGHRAEKLQSPDGNLLECQICAANFPNKVFLQSHLKSHTNNPKEATRKNYCMECDKSFTQCFNYKIHMRHHRGEKVFNCSKCRRKYLTESALAKHLTCHIADQFTCEICGKTYKMKDSLDFHLKTHSDKRPFECKDCGKSFKILGYYNQHVKNHQIIKDFLCSVCGKEFTKVQLLNIHMRIHSGEKPYECKVCGKRFTQSSALSLHSRNHTGERKFRCSLCDQAFFQHHHLQDHVKLKHTKEKTHECKYCDKAFTLKSSLNRHILIHSGEKPHACSVCGMEFREIRQLKVHAKECGQ